MGSDNTEYFRVNGMAIAERNSSGDWIDYVYLGSRLLARAADFDTSLHIYATNSATNQYSLFYLSNAGGLSGYVIRSGDKLNLTQYQGTGSHGGIILGFSDLSTTGWNAKDQDNYYLNDDQSQGITHFRTVDLTPYAGKTIKDIILNSETDTGAILWDVEFEQVALVSVDGRVQPIYTGQSSVSFSSITATSGVSGAGYSIDTNRGNGTLPQQTTTYYHADQLGSMALITSGYNYPVWQARYLPFGYEYNPQITTNHYKYTGHEHDSESGLEYAKHRMLSSQLDRFMSADPCTASMEVGDPQSLNRYTYVNNNPETFSDPTGLFRYVLQYVDPFTTDPFFLCGLYGFCGWGPRIPMWAPLDPPRQSSAVRFRNCLRANNDSIAKANLTYSSYRAAERAASNAGIDTAAVLAIWENENSLLVRWNTNAAGDYGPMQITRAATDQLTNQWGYTLPAGGHDHNLVANLTVGATYFADIMSKEHVPEDQAAGWYRHWKNWRNYPSGVAYNNNFNQHHDAMQQLVDCMQQ